MSLKVDQPLHMTRTIIKLDGRHSLSDDRGHDSTPESDTCTAPMRKTPPGSHRRTSVRVITKTSCPIKIHLAEVSGQQT